MVGRRGLARRTWLPGDHEEHVPERLLDPWQLPERALSKRADVVPAHLTVEQTSQPGYFVHDALVRVVSAPPLMSSAMGESRRRPLPPQGPGAGPVPQPRRPAPHTAGAAV